MTRSRLTRPEEPNPAFQALSSRFFDRISVDERWVSSVRERSSDCSVVYVLRNSNVVDFLALEHVTQRYGLPRIAFANLAADWNPFNGAWLRRLIKTAEPSPTDQLSEALSAPNSGAALFLRRPPSVLDVASGRASRGQREGDDHIDALIEIQRRQERPILLVPVVFVWTRRPDTRGTRTLDVLLGPREWPSSARVIGQFLLNYQNAQLRAGQPVNLSEFLAEWGSGQSSTAALHNKLAYTMLRRLERERRAITGPIDKAPDRVRQEILRSRRFQTALDKLAGTEEERRVALKQADEMLRTMQAMPDGRTHKALDLVLSKVFERIYHGLDVDKAGIEELKELAREGTFVLLPSHKSHIDYLVVSYVFFKANLPLPLIVAGDNLSFFPMGSIFRRGGAFFIRRSFKGDRLYAAVVDAYVRRQIKDGFAIELFLEGMRSRTGKLLDPKFGLLHMIVSAVRGQDSRPVFFVPISIGYERIVETESYRLENSGGDKVMEDAAGLLGATSVLRHRYGRINVQFGHALTLPKVASDLGLGAVSTLSPKQTRSVVVSLGNRVMDEINRVTAVTPGALTALSVLNHHRRGLPHDKLVRHAERLLTVLAKRGARIAPGLAGSASILNHDAIRDAAQMFVDAGMIQVHSPTELSPRREKSGKPQVGPGAIYTLVENKRVELDTSKNIIIHFFAERALVATAMLPSAERACAPETLHERMRELAKLLKFEFRFATNGAFEANARTTLAAMLADAELEMSDAGFVPGQGHDGWSGHKWLLSYASMIRNFLEGYRIFVRALTALLDAPCSEKDLVKKALETGERMYLAGEIERREAVCKPILQNALGSYLDQGVLRSAKELITLGPDFASDEALRRIEQNLAAYLEREGAL